MASGVKVVKLSASYVHERLKVQTGYCKRITAGNVTEFVEMTKRPRAIDCKRISKDYYIKPSEFEKTGEVHEYKHATNKAGSFDSVRRTLSALRSIINANCTDSTRLHWITLTYRENMTDTKRLYTDFKVFWQRFKRWCKKKDLTAPQYIAVAEPQARGAWHMHLLFIWEHKAPFIDNNTVFAPMWGQGFTKIKAVRTDCDNIGAYFSAYLADIPLEESGLTAEQAQEKGFQVVEKSVTEEKKKKAIIKGGRLHLYPSGMNIYRTSRGISRPVVEEITPDQVQEEKRQAGGLTFFSASGVVFPVAGGCGSGGDSSPLQFGQIITKSYYNAKLTQSQAFEKLPFKFIAALPMSEEFSLDSLCYDDDAEIPLGMLCGD